MELAEKSFGEKVKDYSNARAWTQKALANPRMLILRTGDSALVAMCGMLFFDPGSPIVTVQFFAGRQSEVEQLFEALKLWAKAQDVDAIYFQPRTGYNARPLAEKIGAELDFPAFVWRF